MEICLSITIIKRIRFHIYSDEIISDKPMLSFVNGINLYGHE